MTVTVEFDTRFGAVDGTNTFEALLTTDEPTMPSLVLRLEARVEPEFVIVPNMVDLGETGTEHIVKIMTGPTRPRLLAAHSTDPSVSVGRLEFRDTATPTYEIRLTNRLDASPGSHFGNVIVTTSSATTPELRIPVKGVISTPRRAEQ